MSTTVTSIRDITNTLDLGPTGSLQFQFAKLQLAMSEICKANAMDYIDQIQKSQEEQKKISEMMQTVRQAQADAKKNNKSVELDADTLKYMQENGLALPSMDTAKMKQFEDLAKSLGGRTADASGYITLTTNEISLLASAGFATGILAGGKVPASSVSTMQTKLNSAATSIRSFKHEDYDVVIQSLQSKLDQVGSNTQQLMIFVQDFMGQYNSYLQGSNSVIQQANQTLGELAKAR